jgi:MFS family permease
MADGANDMATAPRGGPFAPLRNATFRAIWSANLFSQLGSAIQAVGAAWLMTELTTSHTLVAAVQSSNTAPVLLVGLLAGAIADNYERRTVMLVAQIGMLVVSAVLAVMTFAGLVGPASLLAFTLMVGIGAAINAPAWQASVRAQVGRADLPQAISLNTAAINLARSAGPAAGGLLIAAMGVATGFAINAVSYVAMIWVLLRWRPVQPVPERRPILPAIREGLSFCFRSAPLRKVLARGFAMGFGISGFPALVPSIVRDQLHGTETTLGLVLGMYGVGSVLVAFFVADLRRRFGSERAMAAGVVFYVIAFSALAAVPHSLAVAMACAFAVGLAYNTTVTTLNLAMQLRSPEHILGRCLSTFQAVTLGAFSIGSWVWGGVADGWGLGTALVVAAIWLAVAQVVLWATAPMPRPGEGSVPLD